MMQLFHCFIINFQILTCKMLLVIFVWPCIWRFWPGRGHSTVDLFAVNSSTDDDDDYDVDGGGGGKKRRAASRKKSSSNYPPHQSPQCFTVIIIYRVNAPHKHYSICSIYFTSIRQFFQTQNLIIEIRLSSSSELNFFVHVFSIIIFIGK